MKSLDQLLLHPNTKDTAELFLLRPIGPLLILGASGSGKGRLARTITAAALELDSPDKLSSYAHFYLISKPDDKKEIPIDAIRELTGRLRLKAPGRKQILRSVLIEDAQLMSEEAQNALLKILEEPDDTTLFVLTARNLQSLRPTIVSRTNRLIAHPVSLAQAGEFYSARFDARQIEAAWSLSRGGASLTDALLVGSQEHPLKAAINDAKVFLGRTRYERLLGLEKLAKNKENLSVFLEALDRIFSALHRQALETDRQDAARKLAQDRQTVFGCRQALRQNANHRLLCLHLLLRLNH